MLSNKPWTMEQGGRRPMVNHPSEERDLAWTLRDWVNVLGWTFVCVQTGLGIGRCVDAMTGSSSGHTDSDTITEEEGDDRDGVVQSMGLLDVINFLTVATMVVNGGRSFLGAMWPGKG